MSGEKRMHDVRSATVNDYENLLRCYVGIWESLLEWLPDSFVAPELESIRKSEYGKRLNEGLESKDGLYLVAEENNQIVGVAFGREYAGVCTLSFLGVKKAMRNKGVGSSLLGRLVEEAKKRSAHKIWLFTSPNLLPALSLYIKNGFLPEGFLRKHTRGLDMIVYSKFL
jgi:ribosomal protein S18 acetylase RimI-like enzyme